MITVVEILLTQKPQCGFKVSQHTYNCGQVHLIILKQNQSRHLTDDYCNIKERVIPYCQNRINYIETMEDRRMKNTGRMICMKKKCCDIRLPDPLERIFL